MSGAPSHRRPVRDLLWLASACIAATGVLYLLAVRTGPGQRIDNRLQGGIGPGDTGFRTATEDLLATISVSSLALMGLVIMGIALLRGAPRRAVAAGAMILGANVTTQILKRGLPRPDLTQDVWWADPNSFPSGHTTVAMALAMGLVLVAPASLRTAAAIAGGVYALGVGVAVIGLAWHRPSDVLGAYLVAAAWTALAAAALAVWPDRAVASSAPRSARAWGVALAACVAAFVALVAARTLRELDVLQVVADRTGFVFAAVLCSAVGACLLAAVAVLVARAQPSRAAPRSG